MAGLKEKELMELTNKVMRLRYSMDRDSLDVVFHDISRTDYMILAELVHRMGIHQPETKVYLNEISKELNLPISKVSHMVQNLQSKGYIYWEHDAEGHHGTYIYISETGSTVLEKQRALLHDFFGNIVERMGRDNLVQTLDLMNQFEMAIVAEAENLANQRSEADSV